MGTQTPQLHIPGDYVEAGDFIDTVPIGETDRRKIAYDNAKALYKLRTGSVHVDPLTR